MSYCCEKFAKFAGEIVSASPLAGAYPEGMRPNAQFERDGDGTWNINGCCGGGCYVVTEMVYCPFCGTSLTNPVVCGPVVSDSNHA